MTLSQKYYFRSPMFLPSGIHRYLLLVAGHGTVLVLVVATECSSVSKVT